MKKQTSDRREIIDAEKERIKAERISAFDDKEEGLPIGYDVHISVKQLWASGEGGYPLFQISRKNIKLNALKLLVDSLPTISDSVDLDKIADKELQAEQRKEEEL
jgi:hypothetical protein